MLYYNLIGAYLSVLFSVALHRNTQILLRKGMSVHVHAEYVIYVY